LPFWLKAPICRWNGWCREVQHHTTGALGLSSRLDLRSPSSDSHSAGTRPGHRDLRRGFSAFLIVELLKRNQLKPSLRVPASAIMGRVAGVCVKGFFALIMVIITLTGVYS